MLSSVILLRRPDAALIRRVLEEQHGLEPSYATPGMTRAPSVPRGYVVDRYRACIGDGDADFERARTSLFDWSIWRQPWLELFHEGRPADAGTTVALVSRQAGFFTLNACRVIYRLDERDRSAFAYGSLPEHVERGEERFLVERDAAGRVWFELFAASQPSALLTWLGYPVARRFQRRFGRGAVAAMARAVGSRDESQVGVTLVVD